MKNTIELGGPAIYENDTPDDIEMKRLNGRVTVLRIESSIIEPGRDAFVVKGDEPSNVWAMWVAYPHELRALGG